MQSNGTRKKSSSTSVRTARWRSAKLVSPSATAGHALEHIEEEAERQKIEMKSMIETQRRNLQAKMDAVSKLDEDYARLIQQCEKVKLDVQRTVDNLIANIEAKKQTIFAAVEDQTEKSLESLTTQKTEIENQIEVIKSSLDEADKVLTRSTNPEVVQVKKSLETILEGVNQTTKPTERDLKGLPFWFSWKTKRC